MDFLEDSLDGSHLKEYELVNWVFGGVVLLRDLKTTVDIRLEL